MPSQCCTRFIHTHNRKLQWNVLLYHTTLQYKLYSTVTTNKSLTNTIYARSQHTAPSNYTNKHNNITSGIQSKIGINLHKQPNHPICIVKQYIAEYFNKHFIDPDTKQNVPFHLADDLSPVVSTQKCFDDLFIGIDHISRQSTDTFYYNENTVLRTHTSAHEREMLESNHKSFLIAGDCYRRDEIDSTHYPVFHQLEGVRIFHNQSVEYAVKQLKYTLEGLARHLFGQHVQLKWDNDVTFPWTHPSYELYVMYNGVWLECLGSGILKSRSLEQAGLQNHVAWAFGMGLDRLAMILYNIPDIRLFWSNDSRFINQFTAGNVTTKFQPFSKYPYCYKDITFWLPNNNNQSIHSHDTSVNLHQHSDTGVPMKSVDNTAQSMNDQLVTQTGWHDNDLSAVVREVAGDLVEQIDCIDTFQHPKTKRWSRCYRITYRDLNRNLTNDEVDALQAKVRQEVVQHLGVQIR